MSAIALVILAGSFVPGIDQDMFLESRHIYWADSTAQDPMRSFTSLAISWNASLNQPGIERDKSTTNGEDRIPVHNISECNSYADKLLYNLKTGYMTRTEAIYEEARCVYIPDGFELKSYNAVERISEDGKHIYAENPYELQKIPDPQELAQEQWKKDHPDCLNATADYPLDSKSENLIEAEGSVDLKCFFNKGSDGRYHASQCEVVNVTLDKSYKKKLKKLYESEFADSALEFMKKRCSMVLPGEDIHENKRLMHIDYSQKD